MEKLSTRKVIDTVPEVTELGLKVLGVWGTPSHLVEGFLGGSEGPKLGG